MAVVTPLYHQATSSHSLTHSLTTCLSLFFGQQSTSPMTVFLPFHSIRIHHRGDQTQSAPIPATTTNLPVFYQALSQSSALLKGDFWSPCADTLNFGSLSKSRPKQVRSARLSISPSICPLNVVVTCNSTVLVCRSTLNYAFFEHSFPTTMNCCLSIVHLQLFFSSRKTRISSSSSLSSSYPLGESAQMILGYKLSVNSGINPLRDFSIFLELQSR